MGPTPQLELPVPFDEYCSIELQNTTCNYTPFGCPSDDTTDASFLHKCTCDGTVELQGGRTARMDEIQVGDSIKTQDGNYERIYSFGHKSQDRMADYLELSTSSATKLTISAEHLVYERDAGFIPAADIQVGDIVLVQQEQEEEATITRIRTVRRKGLYAPFTASGTVVVNDVLASSFIAIAPMKFVQNPQWVARIGELPHRVWCTLLQDCSNESYDEEGVNVIWGRLPMDFLEYTTTSSSSNSTIPSWMWQGLVLGCLVVIAILEQVLTTRPLVLFLATTAMVVVVQRRQRNNSSSTKRVS